MRHKMTVAQYFETFNGNDYFRDQHGNIYTQVSGRIAFCSVLKQGNLTPDKAEPYYEVTDTILMKEGKPVC